MTKKEKKREKRRIHTGEETYRRVSAAAGMLWLTQTEPATSKPSPDDFAASEFRHSPLQCIFHVPLHCCALTRRFSLDIAAV